MMGEVIIMNFKKLLLFFVFFIICMNINLASITDDIKFYSSFDEKKTEDISGNGVGVSSTAGSIGYTNYSILGNSLSIYDDYGDYITLNNILITEGDSSVTTSVWVNVDFCGEFSCSGNSEQPGSILFMGDGGHASEVWDSQYYDSNHYSIDIYGSTSPDYANWLISGYVSNLKQNWHHVVYLYNSSSSTRKIYVDGVLSNSDSETLSFTRDLTRIGSDNSGDNEYVGLIDELAVWDRALTENEIDLLYNNGNGFNPYYSIINLKNQNTGEVYSNYTATLLNINDSTYSYLNDSDGLLFVNLSSENKYKLNITSLDNSFMKVINNEFFGNFTEKTIYTSGISEFYVKSIYDNESYENFTISGKNLNTSETFTKTDESGTVFKGLINENVYLFNITSNDETFAYLYNQTVYGNITNKTFYVFDYNSIDINIYDETTEKKINNTNSSIYYSLNTENTVTNDTGFFHLEGLQSGTWTLRGENNNYYDRYYYLTMEDGEYHTLNMYLINITDGVKRNHYIYCENEPVSDALISYYTSINGEYKTVAQRKTDGTGLAPFFLNPNIMYKITIISNQETYLNYFIPSEDPINIDICAGSSGQPYNWTTIYDKFDYLPSPISNIVEAKTTNFSVSFSSENGYLKEFGLYSNSTGIFKESSISGSPNGGELYITLNLTNFTNIIDVYYYANITGENDLFVTKKTYKTPAFSEAGNYSIKETVSEAKNNFSVYWRYIIVTLIAFMVMVGLYRYLPAVANCFVGLGVFASFVYFDWINILYIIPMGAVFLVYIISERYS